MRDNPCLRRIRRFCLTRTQRKERVQGLSLVNATRDIYANVIQTVLAYLSMFIYVLISLSSMCLTMTSEGESGGIIESLSQRALQTRAELACVRFKLGLKRFNVRADATLAVVQPACEDGSLHEASSTFHNLHEVVPTTKVI